MFNIYMNICLFCFVLCIFMNSAKYVFAKGTVTYSTVQMFLGALDVYILIYHTAPSRKCLLSPKFILEWATTSSNIQP